MRRRLKKPPVMPKVVFTGNLTALLRAALDTGQVVGHAERHLLERFLTVSASYPQPVTITKALMDAATMTASADFLLVHPNRANPYFSGG